MRSFTRTLGSTSGSIMTLSKEASALAAAYAPYDLEVQALNGPSSHTHFPPFFCSCTEPIWWHHLVVRPQATKAHVSRRFTEAVRSRFRRFFDSASFDKLFVTCLLYFVARIHHAALSAALHKATRQKAERLKAHVVESKLDELHSKARLSSQGLSTFQGWTHA